VKATEATFTAVVAGLVGLVILKWTWLAELLGITVSMERTGSILTVEYLWGMLAVAVLGYVFYRLPLWCAGWFMFGPILVTHAWHLARFGIPGQWALEVFLLALLTIPYLGIAYGAAYIHKRSKTPAS
jgi:hypothetical protein